MGSSSATADGRVCLRKILNRRIRDPYVRWCERTNNQLMIILLLDLYKYNNILITIVFINQMVYNVISVSLEVLYDYG